MFGNMGFGFSQEDIENVLTANSLQVVNSDGLSFEEMAEKIFDEHGLDFEDRVSDAALSADVIDDDDESTLMAQTDAAHAEIRIILVELGILSS